MPCLPLLDDRARTVDLDGRRSRAEGQGPTSRAAVPVRISLIFPCWSCEDWTIGTIGTIGTGAGTRRLALSHDEEDEDTDERAGILGSRCRGMDMESIRCTEYDDEHSHSHASSAVVRMAGQRTNMSPYGVVCGVRRRTRLACLPARPLSDTHLTLPSFASAFLSFSLPSTQLTYSTYFTSLAFLSSSSTASTASTVCPIDSRSAHAGALQQAHAHAHARAQAQAQAQNAKRTSPVCSVHGYPFRKHSGVFG